MTPVFNAAQEAHLIKTQILEKSYLSILENGKISRKLLHNTRSNTQRLIGVINKCNETLKNKKFRF